MFFLDNLYIFVCVYLLKVLLYISLVVYLLDLLMKYEVFKFLWFFVVIVYINVSEVSEFFFILDVLIVFKCICILYLFELYYLY